MKSMITIDTCPTCGSKSIKKVRRDWSGRHDGIPYVVPDLEYYECPECGEKVYDRDAMRRIETCSPAFQRTPKKRKIA